MKIAYFTDFFFPVLGGVSTAINNLSAGLANRGSEVVIFAPKWRNFTHPVKNKRIQVRFLPSLNVGIPDIRITLLFYPNLYGFMRKFQADVIHVESPLTVGIAGIIIAKLMKKPLVGNFHGYPNWGLVGIKKSTLLNSLYLKYDAFILNFCDLVITPGKIGETELKKHGLKKPIFLIPNSINESEFQEQPAQTVLQLKKKVWFKKERCPVCGSFSYREKHSCSHKKFCPYP
jgi:glycosyltransferase involved in cell wall biosynthesis